MSTKGRVVVTCGPSFEPIDQVRRITNASTGELGIRLANALAGDGWSVVCLKGVGATHPDQLVEAVEHIPFSTNDDLLERLQALPQPSEIAAVFHAAALCDFRVQAAGNSERAKISSRAGELTLVLTPATKLLPGLRTLFPAAQIVGWKYELDGTREDAVAKGRAQIGACASDACVVNGAAYGDGFGVLLPDGRLSHCATKDELCMHLSAWLAEETLCRPA